MVTKRTPLKRRHNRQITDAAIQAWKTADYHGLCHAFGIRPWERSPLPIEVCGLGVGEDDAPDSRLGLLTNRQDAALEIQRALVAEAGWPDCREAFRKNLEEDEGTLRHYEQRLVDLKSGKQVSSPVPMPGELERISKTVEEWRERVAWRRDLLRLEEKAPGKGAWREAN